MAYDPNQQYQQQQNYQQPPPQGAPKSLMAQQLGPSSIGIDPNISAAISYFWIIGLIFFLIEKQNRFVRFHAFQALLLGLAAWIIAIVLSFIPVVNIIGDLAGLVWLIGGIYAAVQAYNGKWFKLPVIGDMAYNNANNWTPGQ